MEKTSIAVMNATGRTGRRIVQALLDAGGPVVALGRSAAKLANLAGATLGRSAANTTPTGVESFAHELAAACKAG